MAVLQVLVLMLRQAYIHLMQDATRGMEGAIRIMVQLKHRESQSDNADFIKRLRVMAVTRSDRVGSGPERENQNAVRDAAKQLLLCIDDQTAILEARIQKMKNLVFAEVQVYESGMQPVYALKHMVLQGLRAQLIGIHSVGYLTPDRVNYICGFLSCWLTISASFEMEDDCKYIWDAIETVLDQKIQGDNELALFDLYAKLNSPGV